jgi:predicted CoA-binding protein
MPDIRYLLEEIHIIAVVGFSHDTAKAGHYVPHYLHDAGYRILPVNPRVAEAWGEPAYASLRDIPDPVDLVLVFRKPQYCPAVVRDALAMPQRPKVIWLQSGILSPEAQQLAEAAGIIFIQNRCIMVDHRHLCGGG